VSSNVPPSVGQPTGIHSAQYAGAPGAAAGYPQPGYPMPAAPQRNTLMFVVSIILIVFGVLDLLFGLLAMIGLSQVSATPILVLSLVFVLVVGVVLLVAGIMGVKNAANPPKGDLLFKIGIGMCAIAVLNLIIGVAGHTSIVAGIGSLLLPALYVVAAKQLKDQSA